MERPPGGRGTAHREILRGAAFEEDEEEECNAVYDADGEDGVDGSSEVRLNNHPEKGHCEGDLERSGGEDVGEQRGKDELTRRGQAKSACRLEHHSRWLHLGAPPPITHPLTRIEGSTFSGGILS